MKKQLFLIVSIVLLALFAGSSNVNAQCTSTGFNPAANQPYVYVVQVDPAGGYLGTGVYNWYVTQDVNLLNVGAIIPNDGSMFTATIAPGLSTYNSALGTTNQLGLTWTSAAVNSPNPFYLVLKYRESNPNSTQPGGCEAENIRVWQINPINTFLLAVNTSFGNGTAFPNGNQCVADVTGAQVNVATSDVTYTYGTNILFYTILASGYNGQWTPAVQLPALAGLGQNYAAVEWTSDLSGLGAYVAFTYPAGGATGGGDFISPSPATISDPVAGTPIMVRVTIANVNFETLADQPIQLGADGTTASGLPDIIGGTGTNACDPEALFGKTAIYTILARPTVTAGTGTFIPKNP